MTQWAKKTYTEKQLVERSHRAADRSRTKLAQKSNFNENYVA
jgi:hypothetical protein